MGALDDRSEITEIHKDDDITVPADIIDPVNIDETWCKHYTANLGSRSRQDIVDDLCMLYLAMPESGYGHRQPMLAALRLAMISEINQRPSQRGKIRLAHRLHLQKIKSHEE